MLCHWLSNVNDQERFTGRVYFTVRDMFTHVKSQLSEVPTTHASF